MKNFIEVINEYNEPIIININAIVSVEKADEHAADGVNVCIKLIGEKYSVSAKQSYDTIKGILGAVEI